MYIWYNILLEIGRVLHITESTFDLQVNTSKWDMNSLHNKNEFYFKYSAWYYFINPSSLNPFSQRYSLKGLGGDIPGPLLKIFVMHGPIDLRFGMNIKWTLNFH